MADLRSKSLVFRPGPGTPQFAMPDLGPGPQGPKMPEIGLALAL
jgi:hypothetical protein